MQQIQRQMGGGGGERGGEHLGGRNDKAHTLLGVPFLLDHRGSTVHEGINGRGELRSSLLPAADTHYSLVACCTTQQRDYGNTVTMQQSNCSDKQSELQGCAALPTSYTTAATLTRCCPAVILNRRCTAALYLPGTAGDTAAQDNDEKLVHDSAWHAQMRKLPYAEQKETELHALGHPTQALLRVCDRRAHSLSNLHNRLHSVCLSACSQARHVQTSRQSKVELCQDPCTSVACTGTGKV